MKTKLLFLLMAALCAPVMFADELPLDGGLEKLRPFLGTWRGEFKRSDPDNPMINIGTWERVLNGKAVRVMHSINDGIYGGESLMFWDAKNEQIEYYYFTTASFRTTGTMKISGKTVTAHEKVIGDSGGTTEVRSTSELKEDGTMITKAEFLKNGSWEPGHEIVYRRAPDAKVIFK